MLRAFDPSSSIRLGPSEYSIKQAQMEREKLIREANAQASAAEAMGNISGGPAPLTFGKKRSQTKTIRV